MPILLAGLASAMYGAADFIGGLATRRAAAVSVVVGSQLAGLVVVVIVAPLLGGTPVPGDWVWGAAAGMSGAGGIAVFYHAIATTRVGVAAPVAAVVATILLVVFGVATGERPSWVAWLGVAVAVPAVVLITAGGDRSDAGRLVTRRAFLLGMVSGIGFGLFGILISRTGDDAGLWPLLGARGGSIVLMAAVAISMGRPLLPGRPAAGLAVIAGSMDMAGNALYLVSIRRGLLSLVSVVLSLYPAVTLLLARTVLGERVVALQAVGLVMAGIGVSLIALG
jgi:drug/metabolite transporter (DMT)-like permease